MKSPSLLQRAEDCWTALSDFRDTRRRNINYIYGDQWSDLVIDDDGRMVTERERIARKTGAPPLQNNHLIKIVHALTGLIAKSGTMPVCIMNDEANTVDAYSPVPSEAASSSVPTSSSSSVGISVPSLSQQLTSILQDNWQLNDMKDLMISQMEELMHGGVCVVCEEWGENRGQANSFTYTVNPDYFFFESKMNDPRLWDVALIGEIRDYKIGELVSRLGHTAFDYEKLKTIYAMKSSPYGFRSPTTQLTSRHDTMDFYFPPEPNLCRTYHVWTHNHRLRYRCIDRNDTVQPVFRIEPDDLTHIKEENRRRQKATPGTVAKPLIEYQPVYEQTWHFSLLAPDGTVLDEYDSPYSHKEHPYVMTAYHFVNGNIYPFMSTVIDQQRYINRLITLNDMYINTSIKGLKMIPKRAIPRDMSIEDFARQAVEVGGWIVYEPDPTGAKPEIITQAANNLGVAEMLNLQINSINEITSVNESLQGVPPQGNTGYARYAMEMENSSTSVAALTNRFMEFQQQLATKKMAVIQQFSNIPIIHDIQSTDYRITL